MIVSYLAFKDAFIDFHSYKCYEKKIERKIKVADFGKSNDEGMMRYEFHHDTNKLLDSMGLSEIN